MFGRLRRPLLALALTLLALIAFWLWPAAQAVVALNRAALVSARAVEGRAAWPQAEDAWLGASRLAAARPAAHRGLAQVFWFWYRADEPAALAAARQLIEGPPAAPDLGDALAAAGDLFRGRGRLAAASFFYHGALTRADFSSAATAIEIERRLALVEHPSGNNLVTNGGFEAGLANWRATGLPRPAAGSGQAELSCANCRLAQTLPLLGSGVYRLGFEMRAAGSGAGLQAALALPDDAPWSYDRRWEATSDWQAVTDYVWMPPYYGEPAWELSLRPAGPAGVMVRGVSLQKVDAPDNRLLNPGFDYYDPQATDPDFSFPPWKTADFWSAARAQGRWRAVAGSHGTPAIEIEMSGSAGPPEHIGVQQSCGEAPAGAAVSLEADLSLPADLAGSAARVQATFYQSGEAGHYVVLTLDSRLKTDGWQHLSTTGRVPDLPGIYKCMLTVGLDAVQPLSGAADAARFDGVTLAVGEP
jgi:hypothetical protein